MEIPIQLGLGASLPMKYVKRIEFSPYRIWVEENDLPQISALTRESQEKFLTDLKRKQAEDF